ESVDRDDTEEAVAFEHRDRERRPDWVHMARPIRIFGVSLSVRDVYRSPLKGSACRDALASRGDRVPFYELSELRRCVVERCEPQELPVEPIDERSVSI